jgi:hypothetical protein
MFDSDLGYVDVVFWSDFMALYSLFFVVYVWIV